MFCYETKLHIYFYIVAPTPAPITADDLLNINTVTSSCSDNAFVRINGMQCRDFVNQYGVQVCARDMVSTHCCESCLSR